MSSPHAPVVEMRRVRNLGIDKLEQMIGRRIPAPQAGQPVDLHLVISTLLRAVLAPMFLLHPLRAASALASET